MCHSPRRVGKEIKRKLKHVPCVVHVKFDEIKPHCMAYGVLFHTSIRANEWDEAQKY